MHTREELTNLLSMANSGNPVALLVARRDAETGIATLRTERAVGYSVALCGAEAKTVGEKQAIADAAMAERDREIGAAAANLRALNSLWDYRMANVAALSRPVVTALKADARERLAKAARGD